MGNGVPTVLVVDDHRDSVEMYCIVLQEFGFGTVTAQDGEQALRLARELRPDVVVVDVSLPGMSGFDLTRRLRADDRTRQAVILVLTGHGRVVVREQAREAGCDGFLVKPCTPDALAAEIRELLAGRCSAATDVPEPLGAGLAAPGGGARAR